MKKNIGIRSALFTLVIIASIASYIFLNLVSFEAAQMDALQSTEMAVPEESTTHHVLLPDVEIIKTLVRKSIHLMY